MDAVQDDEPVDVTLDQKPLESNSELVALAEYAADEILASDAWRGTSRETVEEEEGTIDLLRDGTARSLAKLPSVNETNEAAPELCRALAACAGTRRGARRPRRPRCVIEARSIPAAEKLASTDPDARQAALAALVECAACTSNDDAKEAFPALLAANLDYVVDAACRRLRRAATPETAAKSASVVEVLLRHSQASPPHHYEASCATRCATSTRTACPPVLHMSRRRFLRLMRAMVRAVPHIRERIAL